MKKILAGIMLISSAVQAAEIQGYLSMKPLIRDSGRVVTISIVDKNNERFYVAQCLHKDVSITDSYFMGAIRGFNFDDQNPNHAPQLEFNGANDFEKYIECKKVASILANSTEENPAILKVNELGTIEEVKLKP